jgi:spoIIIJ-associated protein
MEWVETTGRSLDEAKEKALDQLGVDEQDAEFEVLEEPRPGLFGRLRGEARVRARVRPTAPRPKVERRDRRRKKDEEASVSTGDSPTPATAAPPAAPAPAVAPATEAPAAAVATASSGDGASPVDEVADFLRGLADAFGLEAEVKIVPDGDGTEVGLHGADLGLLIGPRGVTLQAVQDLARALVARSDGEHSTKVRVDVGGYRQKRREALARFAEKLALEVEATGTAKVLEPMNAADRKVVHDTVGAMSGVRTRSEGEDPYRRVVIVPADAG